MSLSKIINIRYPDQPADLINAQPTGPIEGYHLNTDSDNQSWEFAVVDDNRLTIRNGTTGTYASVTFETVGSQIVGSPEPYIWQQISIAGGAHQIATVDGKYIWLLTGDQDFDPIVLGQSIYYPGKEAQWAYVPAPRVGS